MTEQSEGPGDDALRGVARDADGVADEARAAREENERAARGGQETDYAFRLPPDVAAADRVRAEDDVELNQRQERVAETQRRAAQDLAENARLIAENARTLGQTERQIEENRRAIHEIRANARDVHLGLDDAREAVERTDVPRVDRGGE
ncbi:MAG TPA: hypothetical protein VFQ45_06455 [Longimicrobium sp.]|nr:hypothetical protein [Longimicrobium sp.]